jgi:hypothetical protein
MGEVAAPPSVTRMSTISKPAWELMLQATRMTLPGSGRAWRMAFPTSAAMTETASASKSGRTALDNSADIRARA